MAGWPVVAHSVCIRVPLGIELGPRNACAHDPRPVRVGVSVWEWSSTVDVVRDVVRDVVDGMAWQGRSDCAGTWACLTPQGAPVVGVVGWRQSVPSKCAGARRSGSVTVA